jgi:hypothetical protein
MKDIGKFYGHSVYFTAISFILRPFGLLCGHFGIFSPVLVCCNKKNLATLRRDFPRFTNVYKKH